MDGGDRKGIFKMSNPQPWESEFRALFERTRAKVAGGERNLERLFTDADRAFLRSIGSKPIEMFDSADDFVAAGEPTLEDMLEIHRMRYEYFTKVQNGKFLPPVTQYRAKPAELGGVPWLPRAIDKVRAKLAGQLLDDFFYPCGGDRAFLKGIKMTPPEFFRLVQDSESDEEVLKKVKQNK